MDEPEKYFKDDYRFLEKSEFKILKPNDDLVCCNDLALKVLTKIDKNRFIDSIEYLYSIYPIEYYKKLLSIVKNKKYIFRIPITIKRYQIDDYDKEIFMRYIESIKNHDMIVTNVPLHDIEFEIHYILMKLTDKQIIGILFQIIFQIHPLQKFNYYNKIAKNYNNEMHIYYIKKNENIIDTLESHQYQISNFNNIVEITQVIFNELSLEVLDYMRLDRLLHNNFKQSFYNHLIYKRFLYYYVKKEHQIRFLLFSCSALFALGTTYCRDIDLLLYDKYMNVEMQHIIDKYVVNLKMIDLHLKGYGEWASGEKKEYLNQWFDKEWPNLYGSANLEETIFNPKFHFYFLGLKIISYKADIARRVKRNRSTAYTDLLMLDYFNGMIITPDPLSRKYWVNNELKEYSDYDLIGLIIKVVKYIVRWHKLIISARRIYEYIRFPSDFKVSSEVLNKIDNDNLIWIQNKKFKIIDSKENLHKREIHIVPYSP